MITNFKNVYITALLVVNTATFGNGNEIEFPNFKTILAAVVNTAIETGYRTNGSYLQAPFPDDIKFPCKLVNTTSPSTPTSVHRLRPGDIDVIASIGDSVTAAVGAASTSIIEILVQNRGFSWSGGGQWDWRNVTTLPNILKVFNPDLVGYAKGDALSSRELAVFNLAENGYISFQMLDMAKRLVTKIRNDERIDFQNQWKMVTLLIGLNDLCKQSCNRTEPSSYPDEFIGNIKETLDYLKDNLPRTFVNLVPAPPIENILLLRDMPDKCKAFQLLICVCLRNSNLKDFLDMVIPIQRKMWQLQYELAQNYRGLDNFTVVYQPFFLNFSIKNSTSESDFTFMAYDCIHLSQKGHAWAGISLWNNLLESTGKKSRGFLNPREKFLCPSPNQFLQTYDNNNQNDEL